MPRGELLALGRIMQPMLVRARNAARSRIPALVGNPASLSRAIVSVFGGAYINGTEAAVSVFGAQLGVTRAGVQNELKRNVTERMLTAIGFARDRLLQQVEGDITVAQLANLSGLAAETMVWKGQDDEAQVISRLAEAEWKTWVRAFARSENRDHHDELNGESIPIDALFRYDLPDGGTAEVYGPRDWNRLPDASEWMNCGHALDYKMVATAEDLEPALRARNVVFEAPRVRETEDEARERRGLPPLRAVGRGGPFRPD